MAVFRFNVSASLSGPWWRCCKEKVKFCKLNKACRQSKSRYSIRNQHHHPPERSIPLHSPIPMVPASQGSFVVAADGGVGGGGAVVVACAASAGALL